MKPTPMSAKPAANATRKSTTLERQNPTRSIDRRWGTVPGDVGAILRHALAVAALLVLGAGATSHSSAATFTIANGDVAGLISAINSANGSPGADSINLASGGHYSLTTSDNAWYGPNGLPAIASEITIEGNGATIERDTAAPKFRLFYISGGGHYHLPTGKLTLRNLTLKGGSAKGGNADIRGGGGGGAGLGGAIFSQGRLVLEGTTVTGNTAQGGTGGNPADRGGGGGGGLGGNGGRQFLFGGSGGGGSASSGASGHSPSDGGGGGALFSSGGSGSDGNGGNGGNGSGGGHGHDGNGGVGGRGGHGGGGGGGGGSLNGEGGTGGFGGFGGGGGGGGGGETISTSGIGGAGGAGGIGGGGGDRPMFAGDGGTGGFGGGGGADGGGGGGGGGLGGAIFVHTGTLTMQGSTFTDNSAVGGTGANNGQGKGGAIFIFSGATASAFEVDFSGNTAAQAGTTATDNVDVYGGPALTPITVTNTEDSGPGSLRQAILDANARTGRSLINFASEVTGTVTLTTGELLITQGLAIIGPGEVSGTDASRVFHIGPGINVAIDDLTITRGRSSESGGGIANDGSTLTMRNCVLVENSAGKAGGAIHNNGRDGGTATLNIVNSTIARNSTYLPGGFSGGDLGGGGIFNDGTDGRASLSVIGCTITANDTADNGGGIGNLADRDGSATLSIIASTISGNSAVFNGGGVVNEGRGFEVTATLEILNSTFSGNSAGEFGASIANRGTTQVLLPGDDPEYPDGLEVVNAALVIGSTILEAGAQNNIFNQAQITSLGYNLNSDTSGAGGPNGFTAYLNQATDQNSTDPMLGPLQDNGGPTFTHALLSGSPAIDRGANIPGSGSDQRGAPRWFDDSGITNASGGDGTDIGAFEFPSPPNTAPTVQCPVAGVFDCAPSIGFSVQVQANVTDLDNGQTLTVTLKEGSATLDTQIAQPTPLDNAGVTFNPVTLLPGVHFLTIEVSDGIVNGSCNTSVTISPDTTAPVAPTLANATGECSVTVSAPTATDNCAGDVTGTTTDPLTYDQPGTFEVHWTFDDGHENTSTAVQTVVVFDNTPPQAPEFKIRKAECSITLDPPIATDNCAGDLTGTTIDPLTYGQPGTFEVHWTFDDGHGNTTTAVQTVVVFDNTPPQAPEFKIRKAECSITLDPPIATDNCAGDVTGTTIDPLTYGSQGTFTVHWTFDDGNGNSSTANQTVIVDDVTAPVAPTLANATGECSVTVSAPTATDNCAGTVTGTTSDALTYSSQGTFTVHWTFDDGNGNSSTANQTVIVDDVTAPVAPTLANATGECSVTVSAPTATENCAGTVTGTTSDALTYSSQGTFTVHWTFNDGNGNFSTANQTVIVHDTIAPVANSQSVSTAQNVPKAITLSATDNCNPSLTYSIVTPPSHGGLTGTAPNLTYTPALNYAGPDSFRFKANDGVQDSSVATISIAVNHPPVANSQIVVPLEDTAKPITLTATDVDANALTYSIGVGPARGTLSGFNPNTGAVTYMPAADYYGPDGFTFKANDGTVDSNVAVVLIGVLPVNDAPSFIKGANQSVQKRSTAVTSTVSNWATSIRAGPANESGQTVNFLVSNNNNGLFTTTGQPAIAANGTLTFTPKANTIGVATVTVRIHDNGGTANGGVDTSATQTFTITVRP